MCIMAVKKLHMAASVEELQKKADINALSLDKKETSKLCKTAEKINKEAQKWYQLQDEEMSFVYYSKFIDLMLTLNKRKDSEKDLLWKSLKKTINEAISRATDLKKSLLKRYEALQESRQEVAKDLKISEIENGLKESTISEKSNRPNSLSDDAVLDNVENSITSSELFALIKERKCSYVIMDARSSNDFQESHINISNCINIPSEILKPGITAKNLEKLMPPASLPNWSKRSKVDKIILIDWDAKDAILESTSNLFNLREAMCHWDLDSPLKKQPQVLIGGYKDWCLKYPMYCTKALDILSLEFSTEKNACITDVSDIQFPDFDENESLVMDKNKKNAILRESSKSLISNQTLPKEQRNKAFNRITETISPFKVADGPNKIETSSTKIFHSSTIEDQINETKRVIPKIDRSLKPLNTHGNDTISAAGEFSSKYSPTDNRSKSQQSYFSVDHEAGENIKLSQENIEKEKKFSGNDEQFDKENIRKLKPDDTFKNVENSMPKPCLKKQLEEEENIKRQREELKKDDLDKFHLHNIEKDGNRPLISSAKMKEEMKGGDVSSLTKEDGTRGLTRSYSSPNIAQLTQQKTLIDNSRMLPSIDRSLKPKVDRMLSIAHDNPAIIRNLNPTYGYSPERALTGLRNLGNTCFMNAIIQCLSNTEQFSAYFLEERHKNHLRRNKHADVAEEFAAVIRGLWTGFKCIAPKDFKNCLAKYIPMYSGNEQQDGHEFLMLLLDKLHNGLNQGHSVESTENLDSLPVDVASKKFWQIHQIRNKSIVSETFEGLLKSTLSCCSCRKTSTSYEVFSCLSLPISNKKTVKDCLEGFLKSEKMSGEGAWHCPACKQKKEAEKILNICEYPKVLIIQLKRFSYTGMWKQKIQTPVEYHLMFDVQGKMYELYGVVNHLGYLEGGHYTAYCKNPNNKKWYKYDDHDTTEISFNEFSTSAAYLLFYTAVENKCR